MKRDALLGLLTDGFWQGRVNDSLGGAWLRLEKLAHVW